MTPTARDRIIQYFTNTPEVTIFLISLKAGGVGLNLTEASRVFILDPWWCVLNSCRSRKSAADLLLSQEPRCRATGHGP